MSQIYCEDKQLFPIIWISLNSLCTNLYWLKTNLCEDHITYRQDCKGPMSQTVTTRRMSMQGDFGTTIIDNYNSTNEWDPKMNWRQINGN
jgi:hypothetical protein